MPFYAPNVNSYKRYVDASWAPTRLAWSYDNRTAGFRVVGRDQSLRIECRIPGADANPYLAFAASLASGLDGMANKTEPPACFVGDIYAAKDLPRVPRTLAEAADRFALSDFAQRAFGADVVEHYTHFFRTEQAAYNAAVTDWERKRYFERISSHQPLPPQSRPPHQGRATFCCLAPVSIRTSESRRFGFNVKHLSKSCCASCSRPCSKRTEPRWA